MAAVLSRYYLVLARSRRILSTAGRAFAHRRTTLAVHKALFLTQIAFKRHFLLARHPALPQHLPYQVMDGLCFLQRPCRSLQQFVVQALKLLLALNHVREIAALWRVAIVVL